MVIRVSSESGEDGRGRVYNGRFSNGFRVRHRGRLRRNGDDYLRVVGW